jgi:hypothetical protein
LNKRHSFDALLIDEGEIRTFKNDEIVTNLPANYFFYQPNVIKCRLKNAVPNNIQQIWSNEACTYFRSLLLRLKTFSLASIDKVAKYQNLAGEDADLYEVDMYYL